MARSSELLPTPLRPSTQVTLPASAVTETWRKRLRRAVVQIDVLDGQHFRLSACLPLPDSRGEGGVRADACSGVERVAAPHPSPLPMEEAWG